MAATKYPGQLLMAFIKNINFVFTGEPVEFVLNTKINTKTKASFRISISTRFYRYYRFKCKVLKRFRFTLLHVKLLLSGSVDNKYVLKYTDNSMCWSS